MPERDNDPIASTQVFRAFVQRGAAQSSGRRRSWVVPLALALAATVAIVVLVTWLIVH